MKTDGRPSHNTPKKTDLNQRKAEAGPGSATIWNNWICLDDFLVGSLARSPLSASYTAVLRFPADRLGGPSYRSGKDPTVRRGGSNSWFLSRC